ncbi:ABC transporter ATP-binding protein [Sphingomonas sp.]|uniref:ABC transporter ATP-binding protein n=1 Tax=Sphingomonas sp. TaxID=28214 RepID=UPI002C2427C0|nr:ABC transporter ATP-binding protein [Sphingomonas sp.]HTG38763.1 ABC transporter ATP-binding protein [Sphingomonas sp.]
MVSIVTQNVTVALGGRTVVRDVSTRLDAGALVGVLGPNGAGKSTLVRALLGLIPHEGSVMLDGAPLSSLSRAAIARQVAYLPQGQTLHWPISVERLVALGRLPHLAPLSRPDDADRAAIERAMARADIAHLAHRTATELSGGERARALLARALAVEAPALIADEPLASLDPAHQIHGMELLRAEADGGGLVAAVLHDLTLAARFCDRVLVMADGALVADGDPRDVLTPELLAEVYGITAYRGTGALPLLVPLDRVR